MKTTAALVLTALALAACGGDTTPPNMNMLPKDPPAPERGIQIKAGEYTVAPGEERYLCWAVTLQEPADVAVTRIDVFDASAVHHVLVSRALQAEPATSECPVLARTTWQPFYGGGKGTKGLVLPDGAGFRIAGNTQVVVQLHLLNATTQPVTEKAFVNLTYAADATQVVPAGIFTLGTLGISIPPGATDYEVGAGCAAPKDLNVFAALPHMHQIGTRITFSYGATQTDARELVRRDPWLFGEQEMELMKLPVKKGEYISTACRYNNTTDKTVGWGESSLDEMCFFAMFYTPYSGGGNGCIK